MQKKLILVLLLALLYPVFGESSAFFEKESLKFSSIEYPPTGNSQFNTLLSEKEWVDSVMSSMTIDQKIGQLFMIAVHLERGEKHKQNSQALVQYNNVGGVIFFKGDPLTQVEFTNKYQTLAKVPLFIGIDGEWGLGMRLDETMSFPKQMTLGAIQDNFLIYKMGAEIARQCKRMGIHLNFAPVVDINSNPNNPVIGNRSFGETKENVATKSIAYMRGLQDNQLLACAKHFPGHGDTHQDSHRILPQVSYNLEHLNDIELFPFKKLIADSLKAILVGHLQIPFLDKKPASLSPNIVTNLLKNELGFKGLIITDALNMNGVKNGRTSGDVDLQAFMAGNDILLYSSHVPTGIQKLKLALAQGVISVDDIDARVRKILKAKYWTGLGNRKPLEVNNLYADLHNDAAKEIKQELYENAITIVRNKANTLPLKNVDGNKYIAVSLGNEKSRDFHQALSKYIKCQELVNEGKPESAFFAEVLQSVDSSKTVILSIHDTKNQFAGLYGVGFATQMFIRELEKKTKVVLCVFASPYCLKYFPESSVVLCGYEDDPLAYNATAEVLFGAIPAKGKLPVSVGFIYHVGDGIDTKAINRQSFSSPESVNMNSEKLKVVEDIASEAINNGVFPGCQILVAKKGKVVYQKSLGKLRYDSPDEVLNNTLYDLASVTKVSATLQAIMLLYDQKRINLDQKASFYLPELIGTNKEMMTIKDLLYHQAGLVAYIPFWEKTFYKNSLNPYYYQSKESAEFPLQVSENLYAKPAIKDSLWKWVIQSPLSTKKDHLGNYSFVYSDLGLIMLQHVVEKITGQNLDTFVSKHFYEPMGMTSTGFNPLQRGILKERIAPTERDMIFRNSQLQGTVHDQTAALQGGVSGHAGLFSTALDLAKLMQMNLDSGKFGGVQYISPETLKLFSQTISPRSHRALGWDKLPVDGDSNYISAKTSSSGFGHSGFTGTMVWVDPKNELIFVFLSNRVFPSATNNKIITLKTRRKLLDAVYDAMK